MPSYTIRFRQYRNEGGDGTGQTGDLYYRSMNTNTKKVEETQKASANAADTTNPMQCVLAIEFRLIGCSLEQETEYLSHETALIGHTDLLFKSQTDA